MCCLQAYPRRRPLNRLGNYAGPLAIDTLSLPAPQAATVPHPALRGESWVNGIVTTQLSPHATMAALRIAFDDTVSVSEVERIVENLEVAVR